MQVESKNAIAFFHQDTRYMLPFNSNVNNDTRTDCTGGMAFLLTVSLRTDFGLMLSIKTELIDLCA
jgi:hypothetical protein